jgi:hypothetical protein
MSAGSSQNTPTNSEMDDRQSLVTPDSEGFLSGLIKEPLENDVLCGRGGSINSHGGNERFRLLVEKRKRVYLTARFKREKRLIASSIVTEIRDLNPPGRFLTRDSKSGHWQDIGDEKARDKTSQALRENAPTIRAEIETEINEQRADMQRAEEEEVARATAMQPPPYYNAGWGYHSSYYGYSHHAPPPPPPPHVHPPHPGHPGYHNGPYGPPHAQWGGPPPPQYPGYDPHYPHGPPPQEAKSALENAADLVSSGAESIKNWTKHSLSFGGGLHSTSSGDGQDRSVASSKPISYVHQPDAKKRRMVKFQDDKPQGRRRLANSAHRPSSAASVHSSNSLIDGNDIEPHSLESSEGHNDSLMNQVANQLLVSFGSWDTSTFCGNNDSDDRVPFPNSGSAPAAPHEEEEEMHVEWEGQEVQLTAKDLDYNSVGSDERMPPPQLRQRQAPDMASSLGGFSSLGSCHSWLPEQIGGAVSYFGGSTASMDMDLHSAGNAPEHLSTGGTEQFSTNGSLGGGSLTRVFEHEALPDDMPSAMTPNMSHRNLSQIPSWERSVRSRSPLSVGSDDDDESLVSKTESVLSKNSDRGSVTSSLSGHLRGATASPTHMDTDEMAWESRE